MPTNSVILNGSLVTAVVKLVDKIKWVNIGRQSLMTAVVVTCWSDFRCQPPLDVVVFQFCAQPMLAWSFPHPWDNLPKNLLGGTPPGISARRDTPWYIWPKNLLDGTWQFSHSRCRISSSTVEGSFGGMASILLLYPLNVQVLHVLYGFTYNYNLLQFDCTMFPSVVAELFAIYLTAFTTIKCIFFRPSTLASTKY